MRILCVATKPPWPPIDGGRLLLRNTLQAFASHGLDVTLVAPCPRSAYNRGLLHMRLRELCSPHLVTVSRPWWPLVVARAWSRGRPLSIERHRHEAVRAEVSRLLAAERFDLVEAEQLQALPQCAAAFERGIPVVLRAQNVESDVWAARTASHRLGARMLARVTARLARWEREAVEASAATIALTPHDAARFVQLAGSAADKVHCVPAPFPADLPLSRAGFAGAPPVVVFGSRDWFPNQQGAEWFVHQVWPTVREQLPSAVLHLVGLRVRENTPAGLVTHAPPDDSAGAFPLGAILVVPSRIASGVRMKILEAWARGVPVVSTPEAAVGLAAWPGHHLLIAHDAYGFAGAIRRLHADAATASALTEAGRALLRARHDPLTVAARLLDVYRPLCREPRAGRPSISRLPRRAEAPAAS